MKPTQIRNRAKVGLALVVVGILLGWGSCSRHVRAARLLGRFADTQSQPSGIDETSFMLDTPTGPTRAKIYSPHGSSHLPGIVIVPGVHHLGVDEPRLQRFARAVAASGITVMTPECKELIDYQIQASSIRTIGAAADELAKRVGRERVGVMGMSFAGGLALLAAANDDSKKSIGFVVAVGAHDDIRHVARFFAKNEAIEPNGNIVHMKAHPYGIMVLAYEHVDDFFTKEDAPIAHDAMREWLWEEKGPARELEKKMSLAGQAKFDLLAEPPPVDAKSGVFPEHPLSAEILGGLELYGPALDAVSPHGHLASIHVPVYLVHGEGDDVIPMTETEWLAQEIPREDLREALISPALQHVELQGEPTFSQKWDLVHFMARVLEEADNER